MPQCPVRAWLPGKQGKDEGSWNDGVVRVIFSERVCPSGRDGGELVAVDQVGGHETVPAIPGVFGGFYFRGGEADNGCAAFPVCDFRRGGW